jgi:hypothetical protein
MKRILSTFLMLVLMLSLLLPIPAHAEGEGNIDNGGGGMGSGTSTNFWNPGDEGVRVTVIRVSDHAVVTMPIDLTNRQPVIAINFKKVCKISYTGGRALSPDTNAYDYITQLSRCPKS